MDGTCDVPGCTNETYMGWQASAESRGKQICEPHWNRHKDPNDSFNLWDAFGFRKPAGVNRPAPKPITEKPLPQLALEPDRGRVVFTEPDVTPEPPQKEPDRPEPQKPELQPIPAPGKPAGCKACGAEREAGHTFCQKCSRNRKAKSNRQRRMRAYRKTRECSAFARVSTGPVP